MPERIHRPLSHCIIPGKGFMHPSLLIPLSRSRNWSSLHALISWLTDWVIFKRQSSSCQVFINITAAAAAKSLQLCPTLCNPIDSSPPGCPIPGILQARTLEWVAISFSNEWKWKVKSEIEVTQSCPTLSDPMDCSLPGSSAHGIFQTRVLEWVATAFSA